MSLASRLTRSSLGRMLPRRRPSAVLAIDLGLTAVKAVHVRRDGTTLVLDGFRVLRLREETDSQSLEAACREALELRLADEPIAISIASSGAAIRKVDLPPMTFDELAQALPWEARRQISGLADDAMVDAQVLNPGGDGAPMEVLLVAFPRSDYERVEALWTGLGVAPEFVDLRPLATMNSLRCRESFSPSASVAVLDLGSAESFFAIFSELSVILFRDLSPRVVQLNSLLASHFSLDPGLVEDMKLSGKFPDEKTPAAAAVQKALVSLTAELNEDLRSGVVFFENHTGGSLERVYLTGGNSIFLDHHGILEMLSAQSGLTLERYNPFQTFRLGLIDEIGLKAAASELCAAAGVAARFFGGA